MRKEENVATLLRLVEEAFESGAGLVVLPEMATTGYVFRGRDEIAPYVEPVPGPTTRAFGHLAASAKAALVLGLAEVDPDTGAHFNSAVLIGPDGRVSGRYRKTHSFHCDTFWAAEGNLGLPVFEGAWPGPLAMQICMDACYFEPARVQALDGARVLAFPTNWLGPAPAVEWRARAAENGVFFVAANRWGEERGFTFSGGTCIIGPSGEVLAVKERGDGVVAADLDLGLARGPDAAARPLVRRPDLYHSLLRYQYFWPRGLNYRHLGCGRFWLGAVEGPAEDFLSLDEPGESDVFPGLPGEVGRRVMALPPLPRVDPLLAAARRAGAYMAAAIGRGPGEEMVLAGPEGLIGRYRSPHRTPWSPRTPRTPRPPHPDDTAHDTEPAFPVFDLPFARVGLLHPVELLLPEPARILSKQGADIILASGRMPGPPGPEFFWTERTVGNDIWLALATGGRAGVFSGEPSAERADDAGRKLEGEERLSPRVVGLCGRTGWGSFSRRKDTLRRLRPGLYMSLAASGRRPAAAGGEPPHGEDDRALG